MLKVFDVNNLKFGDKLRTKNGRVAVYLRIDTYDGHLLLAIKHRPDNCYFEHYKIKDNILIVAHSRLNDDSDIIGYWED